MKTRKGRGIIVLITHRPATERIFVDLWLSTSGYEAGRAWPGLEGGVHSVIIICYFILGSLFPPLFILFKFTTMFYFNFRFIIEKCDGTLVVENKKKKVIIDELKKKGFDPDPVRMWKLKQNKEEALVSTCYIYCWKWMLGKHFLLAAFKIF